MYWDPRRMDVSCLVTLSTGRCFSYCRGYFKRNALILIINDKSTLIIICFFMSPNDTPQTSGILCAYILKGFECRQAQGFFSSPPHPHHLSSSSTEIKMRGILSLHAFTARYFSTGKTTLYTYVSNTG
jgi:hypothetical protein